MSQRILASLSISMVSCLILSCIDKHSGHSVDANTIKALKSRGAVQKRHASKNGIETPKFKNQIELSKITFMNEVVDDAALRAIPMHYDHGNGLAAADVNGDGFVDIYFVSQLGSNELWLNRGDGSFELSPDNQVLEVADRVSVAASFADTDNDGDADLYVTTVRDGNLFFENKGGRFTDMTEQSGLGYKGHSSGVVFFDANNDGLLDLFLSNVGEYTTSRRAESNYCIGYEDAFFFHKDASRSEASRLYLNRGENTFQDVSENYLPKALGWNGDAFFHDFNRDGLADLYVLNMQGDDSVLFNKRGKAFELA